MHSSQLTANDEQDCGPDRWISYEAQAVDW